MKDLTSADWKETYWAYEKVVETAAILVAV